MKPAHSLRSTVFGKMTPSIKRLKLIFSIIKPPPSPPMYIYGFPIDKVTIHKLLGVYIYLTTLSRIIIASILSNERVSGYPSGAKENLPGQEKVQDSSLMRFSVRCPGLG